ncbi:MAG: bifunctional precorrin-2 dehydrogenase/sirohydrochlorin ferrochelatase [Planctomycetes bacterium]|nr:bifunctional precorrin-2 dehydrogenase/sirohydrochlorin ferrochelatase [Planctomycetota bacterium]
MGAIPYTIGLLLKGKKALVVGGGPVALRKALTLSEAGARVVVVAPAMEPEFAAHARARGWRLVRRRFRASDLDGATLAIGATDRLEVNEAVARGCERRGIPVNLAAPPERSTFLVPALHRQGDLVLSVSTNGQSPALAQAIREELRRSYGPTFAAFLACVGQARRRVLERVEDPAARRRLLKRLAGPALLRAFREGGLRGARARVATALAGRRLLDRADARPASPARKTKR